MRAVTLYLLTGDLILLELRSVNSVPADSLAVFDFNFKSSSSSFKSSDSQDLQG